MDGPHWSTRGMSRTFFGREGIDWIKTLIDRNPLYLDGIQLQVNSSVTSDRRQWRLIDVERFAHAVAEKGYLSVEQLVRVLDQIRIIAESWGYLPPKPIPTRLADHDPDREDIYVVKQIDEVIDDLDGTKGATHRTFALGDVEYHLDLTEEHWNDLLALVSPFVKVARCNQGRTDNPAERADRAKVREWARKNGYQIGLR